MKLSEHVLIEGIIKTFSLIIASFCFVLLLHSINNIIIFDNIEQTVSLKFLTHSFTHLIINFYIIQNNNNNHIN
jgi:hypothetical protein